jgi:hypothetical protein
MENDFCVYRCIESIILGYFPMNHEEIFEKSLNYFLTKYMKKKYDNHIENERYALGKTVEKLLKYSHEIKKENYSGIDWDFHH